MKKIIVSICLIVFFVVFAHITYFLAYGDSLHDRIVKKGWEVGIHVEQFQMLFTVLLWIALIVFLLSTIVLIILGSAYFFVRKDMVKSKMVKKYIRYSVIGVFSSFVLYIMTASIQTLGGIMQ